MMVGSIAPWVQVEGKRGDARFDEYPDFSLAQWHRQQGLTSRGKALGAVARKKKSQP
jgi:hypothetical protein